jgi:hypothetical protein
MRQRLRSCGQLGSRPFDRDAQQADEARHPPDRKHSGRALSLRHGDSAQSACSIIERTAVTTSTPPAIDHHQWVDAA